MRCERHIDTNDEDFCYKCEELTIEENKKKYEDIIRNNSLQRIEGDKETTAVSLGLQETRRRDSNSL